MCLAGIDSDVSRQICNQGDVLITHSNEHDVTAMTNYL